MMSKKYLLAFIAAALVSLTLFSACCKKAKEPKLSPHIQERIVHDIYFCDLKKVMEDRDNIFLAMDVLGWEEVAIPEDSEIEPEMKGKIFPFMLKGGEPRSKHHFSHVAYSAVSVDPKIPSGGIALVKIYSKASDFNTGLLSQKGGILEYYGFTDNYKSFGEEPDAFVQVRIAQNKKLNLGAIVLASRTKSIENGVVVEGEDLSLMMQVLDWEIVLKLLENAEGVGVSSQLKEMSISAKIISSSSQEVD